MEIVQVPSMDDQIQHIKALAAYLQACFDPIDFCIPKELGRCKGFHESSLILAYWGPVVQGI